MNGHKKSSIGFIILGFMIASLTTACGTRGSYTGSGNRGAAADGDLVESSEALPAETEKQNTESAKKHTEPTEPETKYNGNYWKVKTADWKDTVDWIVMHGLNGELYIEYDGKQAAVPWARHTLGAGEGGSFYVQDVTGDGYEDLIGAMYIREFSTFFVYDLKNEKDLSPYYCKNHDLYKGLYTKEEYASRINEELKPLFEENGTPPTDVSYLSVQSVPIGSCHAERGENGFFENGVLTYVYNGLGWHCTVEYDFTGGECNMRIVEAGTQYSRLKEIFDVHGEHILEAKVLSDNKVVIANEDIEITVTSNYNTGNGSVILKHKDWESEYTPEDWYFNYTSDQVYFEFYDYDNDGKNELVYHTVIDGEDQVQIYTFEQ